MAKSLRDIYKKKDKGDDHHHHSGHHCCGMAAFSQQGMGYHDLDELVKSPQPLNFVIGKKCNNSAPGQECQVEYLINLIERCERLIINFNEI